MTTTRITDERLKEIRDMCVPSSDATIALDELIERRAATPSAEAMRDALRSTGYVTNSQASQLAYLVLALLERNTP